MVFLQAAVSRKGPAFAILLLAETGRFSLLISDEILTEVREVLFRPSVQERFPPLTAEFVDVSFAVGEDGYPDRCGNARLSICA
jgi:predicted nucleic acid-binding protein